MRLLLNFVAPKSSVGRGDGLLDRRSLGFENAPPAVLILPSSNEANLKS